jgi:hypothetical protein
MQNDKHSKIQLIVMWSVMKFRQEQNLGLIKTRFSKPGNIQTHFPSHISSTRESTPKGDVNENMNEYIVYYESSDCEYEMSYEYTYYRK